MKGKNQRSLAHKANQESQARISELEVEVERLSAIENVSHLYVQALGEIERLSIKVASLETTARDAERSVDRYLAALERIEELKVANERRGDAIRAAVDRYVSGCDRAVHPMDVIANLLDMFGVVGIGQTDIERMMWDRSHRSNVENARAGRMRAGCTAERIIAAIDSQGFVDDGVDVA